jgi:predicted transcriptional regulator
MRADGWSVRRTAEALNISKSAVAEYAPGEVSANPRFGRQRKSA